MHVASKELCEELYKLSGWHGTNLFWDCTGERPALGYTEFPTGSSLGDLYMHAYDLGYLLRKLPRTLQDRRRIDHFLIIANGNAAETNWCADYVAWGLGNDNHWYVRQVMRIEPKLTDGDTPEDALCSLAIALFKQGILTKEKEE